MPCPDVGYKNLAGVVFKLRLNNMKTLLKLEMVGLFGLLVFMFSQTAFAWWLYPVLFLLPDLGMLGYLVSQKIGAYTYNLVHHFAIATLLIVVGVLSEMGLVELAGIIMLGHAALDRVFDYGLKYTDAFRHTHLGQLK